MKDLIPENPTPKEDEVLFVVAPLPVLGPPALDELVAPIAYKTFDLIAHFGEDENVKSGMKGTHPDAIEAWTFDPVSQEELLKRLAPFKKVILLSGDVHYSSSQRLVLLDERQCESRGLFCAVNIQRIPEHHAQLYPEGQPAFCCRPKNNTAKPKSGTVRMA